MTVARSVARSVASPVARPVAGGIGGGGPSYDADAQNWFTVKYVSNATVTQGY